MNDQPDISDEVSETAKAVQDVDKALGNPISLVLGPSAKLIGEHLGRKTAAWLSPKQTENVRQAIAEAEQTRQIEFTDDITPRQIGALIEWTGYVKDVDRDQQPLLTQAWSQALEDISRQNYVLIDALSKLEEEQIDRFLSGGTISEEHAEYFSRIGMMTTEEEPDIPNPLSSIILLAFGLSLLSIIISGIIFLSIKVFAIETGRQTASDIFSLAIPIAGMSIVTLLASDFAFKTIPIFKRYARIDKTGKLTNLGRLVLERLGIKEIPDYKIKD